MSSWISFALLALAGVIHLGFFIIEGFVLQRPGAHKILKITPEQHEAVKAWAKNQAFYNLFLALGTFVGLNFVLQKKIMLAGTLVGFTGLCMIGAGIVLWFTAPHLRKAALLQALPPAIGFVFLATHILESIGRI